MTRDVKETEEFLDGVEVIVVHAIKIADNGISLKEDLPHVFSLIKEADTISKAIEGVDEIDDEMKDIDEQEAIKLGMRTFQLYKNVKKAKAEAKAAREQKA